MDKPVFLSWITPEGDRRCGKFEVDTKSDTTRQISKFVTFIQTVLGGSQVKEVGLSRYLAKQYIQHEEIHKN